MTKKMLIDATHAEETRVAVVDGTRLVDYDYESKVRKQLKGSIFLAKITRVEPSLQAAFVNFGGNRHAFLPFSEIHPDYFRIPIADREALLAEQDSEMQARQAEEEAAEHAAVEGNTVKSPEEIEAEEDEEEDEVEEIGGEDVVAPEDEEEEELKAAEVGGETQEEVAAQPMSMYQNSADVIQDEAVMDQVSHDDLQDNGQEVAPADFGLMPAHETIEGEAIAEGQSAPQTEEVGQTGPENGREGGRRRYNGGRSRGGRGRRPGGGGRDRQDRNERGGDRGDRSSQRVETVGGDGVEGDHAFRPTMRRNYKIQEVIKRGQILLIQVSKEERGNKGAAVTTYLSLPGRYCVLMPNSTRAGGVSRKIANFEERHRMRDILADLHVPEGMSVIMRTAGMSRTQPEIKRDLDYLTKLWDNIRELTLQSTAPALIHEEGQLIRRSIRDIYGRDVDEVQVAGQEGFEQARDFMKMMIPTQVDNVIHYADEQTPLFNKFQVEAQITAMSEPVVTLRSGGYLVINPTEALVSVDVNSGRATRERHIEETALKTNLEAAEEVARQLRLRDLGGLVVIDFIDMEDRRHNRKVEEKLKQALSSDRARIQIGRISSFGLLELSRQRLNPSLTEAQFEKCKHCAGTGVVRTVDAATITALRALEEEGIKGKATEVTLHVSNDVAIYILNNKRAMLADIERRYGFHVVIQVDANLPDAGFTVEATKTGGMAVTPRPVTAVTEYGAGDDGADEEDIGAEPSDSQSSRERAPRDGNREGGREGSSRGGRRRGRRGGRRNGPEGANEQPRRWEEGNDQQAPQHSQEQAFDPAGNDLAARDYEEAPGDNIGNRIVDEALPEDNIGNRAPRERAEGTRPRSRSRGGRNRSGRGEGRSESRSENRGRTSREAGNNGELAPAESAGVPEIQPVFEAPNIEATQPAALRETAPVNNDNTPASRDYERVNEPAAEKKKGWWSKKGLNLIFFSHTMTKFFCILTIVGADSRWFIVIYWKSWR